MSQRTSRESAALDSFKVVRARQQDMERALRRRQRLLSSLALLSIALSLVSLAMSTRAFWSAL